MGCGAAGPAGGAGRPRRFRRRHVLQQPEDAARRPALAAELQPGRRCGCSSANAGPWPAWRRTWCRPCPSASRPTVISHAAHWHCAPPWRSPMPSAPTATPASTTRPCSCHAGRIVSRDECLALNPLIDPAGVTGGAVWFDYQMRQAERVVLAAVQSAEAGGAVAANYVEARGLVRAGARVAGVQVEDRLTSERFDVRATAVLNAAGPWAGAVLRGCSAPPVAAAGGAAVAGHEPGHRSRHRRRTPAAASSTDGSCSSCRGATSRSSAPATTSTTATPTRAHGTAGPRRGPARTTRRGRFRAPG